MPPLSRDAILTVLSGLSLLGCDKGAAVTAEPVASAAPAAAATPAASAAPAAVGSGGVVAKEVTPAQGKAAEKEKSCAPGGCAAGQCGGSKK